MENEVINEVLCPIFRQKIDIGLCSEVQDVYDNMLREESVPEILPYLNNESKEICKSCPKRQNPAL